MRSGRITDCLELATLKWLTLDIGKSNFSTVNDPLAPLQQRGEVEQQIVWYYKRKSVDGQPFFGSTKNIIDITVALKKLAHETVWTNNCYLQPV